MDILNQIPNWVLLVAVVALVIAGNAKSVWNKIKPLISTSGSSRHIAALDEIAAIIATKCKGDQRAECLTSYDRLKADLIKVLDAKDM